MHILFVCTGNICRSPTAERLACAYAERLQVPGLRASSAGIRAVAGHPVHPDAAGVLQELGGDASNFAARQLTSRIAVDADLVLTMTRRHRTAVLNLVPHRLHRVFTLSEAARLASECGAGSVAELAALRPRVRADDAPDVPDPIGRDPIFFATVGAQIAMLLPPVLGLSPAG